MNSILSTVKKTASGIDSSCEHFDDEIILFTNSCFSTLNQLGVGPISGFQVNSAEEVWTDYLEEGVLLNWAKEYVTIKVKLAFDPPANQSVVASLERRVGELEFRMKEETHI